MNGARPPVRALVRFYIGRWRHNRQMPRSCAAAQAALVLAIDAARPATQSRSQGAGGHAPAKLGSQENSGLRR